MGLQLSQLRVGRIVFRYSSANIMNGKLRAFLVLMRGPVMLQCLACAH